jgi:predicted permease
VLNRTLVVNGYPLTIVGVAPRGFEGTTFGDRPDVFAPLSMRGVLNPLTSDPGFENRRSYWLYLFARLAPEVSREQAQVQLNAVYQPIIREVEAPLQAGLTEATLERFRAREVALADGRRGQSAVHEEGRVPLALLLGITGIVLLIACANIANLLLARGAGRRHEMAVRGSLGAGRSRLLGQLLTESCVLALLGGAASLLVAYWTLRGIGALVPAEIADLLELQLQPVVVLFAAVLSLGTGLLFGLYPALHATRSDLAAALRASAGRGSGVRGAARFRSALVTMQIALSMALLVSAGLFARSLFNVSRAELGLRVENVATFDVFPALNGHAPDATRALLARLEEELAALPGVTGASSASVGVLRGDNWGNDVSVEGWEVAPGTNSVSQLNLVGSEYFRTLGTPLLTGREFTGADDRTAPPVAVVNETFLRRFGLDERDAVGRRVALGRGRADLDIEIVGVVQDAVYNHVREGMQPLLFLPWRQSDDIGGLTFYARTGMEPTAVLTAIPGVVQRLDPNLPVQSLKTLERQVYDNTFLTRMIGILSAAFAGLATLLAAVGLYGVMAYTVAQRTREIGVRMALGAGSRSIRALVLGQMARLGLVGGAIGLAAALGLGRAARSLLFGVEGHDPQVMALGVVVVGLVAVAAAYLPARRASSVDPIVALRAE